MCMLFHELQKYRHLYSHANFFHPTIQKTFIHASYYLTYVSQIATYVKNNGICYAVIDLSDSQFPKKKIDLE